MWSAARLTCSGCGETACLTCGGCGQTARLTCGLTTVSCLHTLQGGVNPLVSQRRNATANRVLWPARRGEVGTTAHAPGRLVGKVKSPFPSSPCLGKGVSHQLQPHPLCFPCGGLALGGWLSQNRSIASTCCYTGQPIRQTSSCQLHQFHTGHKSCTRCLIHAPTQASNSIRHCVTPQSKHTSPPKVHPP